MKSKIIGFSFLIMFSFSSPLFSQSGKSCQSNVNIGAYYFDGWAGQNASKEPWAQNAPTHLTKRMVEEFPMREPLWGWRDDALEIMERQIDLAADNGITFFAFCWYWQDNKQAINIDAINKDPKHIGLELFLRAKNSHRLKFCLLVANHTGAEITGAENWKQAAKFWMQYFKNPRYVTVDKKPLVIIFHPAGADKDGLSNMQEVATGEGLPGFAVAACGKGNVNIGFGYRTHYNVIPGYTAGSEQHKYSELLAAQMKAWGGSSQQPYIPAVISGWDKRPWEESISSQGWYYPDRTPEQFSNCIKEAIQWMNKNPDQTTKERIILIYAWNEYGEGGYIAPTKGDPDGRYLKAIRSLVKTSGQQ